jgi:hypothetical protein
VSYGNESRLAEGMSEKSAVVTCPRCFYARVNRIERKGFMEKHIYPLFGFYPWYCRECRTNILIRKRYRRRSSRKNYVNENKES